MKLLKRKTQKAIEKSVRKAMKKHGPALLAGLASAVASSVATLAKTEAVGKLGKSNLADLVERTEQSLKGKDKKKARTRHSTRARQGHSRSQPEDSQRAVN